VRTIALEEHFTTKESAAYAAGIASIAQPGVWAEALRLLLDVTAERLSAMDEAGLDVQLLSLNAPGIQAEKNTSALSAAPRP
jgi:2,3-dihydroxybenzoate decarboxylase